MTTLGVVALLVVVAGAAVVLATTGPNRVAKVPRLPVSTGCDLHATTSNFSSVFDSTNGQTICLASGNYGTFTGGIKSAMTTIEPENGATVTMALDFNPAANITVDRLNITSGFLNGSQTHNITVRNSHFDRAQIVMRTDSMSPNANILLDHNVHSNYDACSNCYEGRVEVMGNHGSNGITIRNSAFYGGNSDGIQDASNGTRILNNEFHDIIQLDGPSAAHVDSIQLLGSSNTLVRGNYLHDVSTGIMAADGLDHATIENNVFKDSSYAYAVTVGSDNGSVIRHNTLWGSGHTCAFGVECGILALGNKDGDPTSTGTVIKDNILTGIIDGGHPTQNLTEDYNLVAQGGAGAHDVRGVPTYVGGPSPTTLAGFALTATSPGHEDADDGDIGATIP